MDGLGRGDLAGVPDDGAEVGVEGDLDEVGSLDDVEGVGAEDPAEPGLRLADPDRIVQTFATETIYGNHAILP